MNTLRKKLTAVGVAGSLGVGLLALPAVPASAAPVAPNQNIVKQAAPQQNENVRHRRWVGPAIALGIIGGAIAADHYYHRRYYRRHYYQPYYAPAYYYAPPAYYYGYPRYRYYGW